MGVGMSGGAGMMGGGMGGMGGGMMGGGMGMPDPATITIRATKSAIDAFAKAEIDFEQFEKSVKVFTY